ncbi:MAG: ribonuclease HII [Acidimicrobiales bacterium]
MGRTVRQVVPSLAFERELWAAGREALVGVDEVGRGAWAGPLMVGAAVLPRDRRVYRVRDSKMLTERQREHLFDRVARWCLAWAVGEATQVECDELGMASAQRLAARRAIDSLGIVPDGVLLDGNWDFVGGATRIVKGDARCLSIAAASVLAKVTRDRYMRSEAPHYPGYDFDANKGYPCPRHKMALQAYGPTAIHRRTWVFMEHLSWGVAGSRVVRRPADPFQEELPGMV